MKSFAKLPAGGSFFSEDVAQRAGFRMQSVKALVWVVVVGRSSGVSAPGASRVGTEKFACPNGTATEGSPVMKSAAALRDMFKWQCGACSEESGPLDCLVESAMRYTESSAFEHVLVRGAPRAPRCRPRASPFAEDYPESSPDPEWQLFLAFSAGYAPGHLAVEPYRLSQGRVAWGDLPGASYGGAGFAYQYVSRAQSWCQLLVQLCLSPAVFRRDCAVMPEVAASALAVCFKMMVVGSRPQSVY